MRVPLSLCVCVACSEYDEVRYTRRHYLPLKSYFSYLLSSFIDSLVSAVRVSMTRGCVRMRINSEIDPIDIVHAIECLTRERTTDKKYSLLPHQL